MKAASALEGWSENIKGNRQEFSLHTRYAFISSHTYPTCIQNYFGKHKPELDQVYPWGRGDDLYLKIGVP